MQGHDFKVWCKKNNEWEKHSCVLLDNGCLMQATHNIPLKKETHIVVWYTGKKDKNGEKLYTHDILKIANDHLAIICWNFETAAFACRLIGSEKPYCDHLYAVEMTEKVGNKFENPELLEEEKK